MGPSSLYTFIAIAVCVIWPLWESRETLAMIARGIRNDLTGKRFEKA